MPQGIYSERLRSILISVQGLSVYGFLDLGDIGSVDYTIYGGTQPIDLDEPIVKDVLLGTMFGMEDADDAEFTYAYGAQLFWNTPVIGLRFGQSFYSSSVEVSGKNVRYPWYQENIVEGTLDTTLRTITSVEYQQERYTLKAEYMYTQFEVPESPIGGVMTPYGFPSGGEWGFDLQSLYLQFQYQISEKWELGAYQSWYYRKLNDSWDRDNPEEKLNDTVVSAKYTVNDWWTVKAEMHFFDGYLFVSPDDSGVPEDTWQMLAFKSTFSF